MNSNEVNVGQVGNVSGSARQQYVAEILRRHEAGLLNALEAFRPVYGNPNDDESDQEYMRRCAEQDYADSEHSGSVYQGLIDSLEQQGNVMTNSPNNDFLRLARENYAHEMQARVAREGTPVPARVIRAFIESQKAFIQSLLIDGQGITKNDIAFMETSCRTTVAAYHWDACDGEARNALLSDENPHVQAIAARNELLAQDCVEFPKDAMNPENAVVDSSSPCM